MAEVLNLYTVYFNPKDFPPESYVVRRWELDVPKEVVSVTTSLEAARATIPVGSYRLERDVNDDPCILETWI
jgi:hypothetical protein